MQKAVRLMPCWPAQSPDLLPIENVWEILKRRLDGLKVDSLNHLWDLVQREWYAIENDTISKFYASMPSRVYATIKSRGQYSKYRVRHNVVALLLAYIFLQNTIILFFFS